MDNLYLQVEDGEIIWYQTGHKGQRSGDPYDSYAGLIFKSLGAVSSDAVLQVQKPSDRLGDFTVSRGSVATRVNPQGLVEDVFELSDELVTNGDFSNGGAAWTIPNSVSIVGGEAVFDGTGSFEALEQGLSADLEAKTYQYSYTITEYTSGTIRFKINTGGVAPGFDDADRSSVGTFTGTYTATGGENLLFLQARGTFVGKIDNVSVKEISYDIARIDYTNGVPELLTEPESTNLLASSEDFTSANWSKINTSVSSNSIVSPDGNLSADLITVTGASGRVIASGTSIIGSNTVSIYLKYSDQTQTLIRLLDGTTTFTLTLDWVGTEPIYNSDNGDSYSIKEFINGWYFVTFSATLVSTTATSQIYINGFGSGGSGYIWGAQLEALPYATSYIPTAGSTVTRLQDVITDGGNVNVINSEEGTLLFEGSALFDDLTIRELSVNDGSGANRLEIRYNTASNQIQAIQRSASTANVIINYNVSDIADNNKVAFKWKAGDYALWINGVERATSVFATTFAANILNSVDFNDGIPTSPFFGRTRALKVYDRALTDEELTTVTT